MSKAIEMNRGKLYLIPNVISDNTHQSVISRQVTELLPGIRHFLAEDIRTARRYLSSLKIYDSIESLNFQLLNKDTSQEEIVSLLAPAFQGLDIGIISEAGCPGIADPGALAVIRAHENNIQVVPLVGPSSLLLALMASGLNGQRFAFHGYLPIDNQECAKTIRALEMESMQKNQTQMVIETPYRNNQVKETILKTLKNDTLLSIAIDITGEQEKIMTQSVKAWKAVEYRIPKLPAVFLFLSA